MKKEYLVASFFVVIIIFFAIVVTRIKYKINIEAEKSVVHNFSIEDNEYVFKTYNSGENHCVVTYNGIDILYGNINVEFDEKNDESQYKPGIYKVVGSNKEIIYENDDCEGIYSLAIKGGWIYFVENSLKEKNSDETRWHCSYISRITVDGKNYEKMMKRDAIMLHTDGDYLYFIEMDSSELYSYNLKEKTEEKILDFTDSYYVYKDIIYSYSGKDKKMKVFNANNKNNFIINGIYDTPIVYNGYIYYIRSKSRSDVFKEGDYYYLCRKKIEKDAKEEIVYKTNKNIFGYAVSDSCVFMSLGKCEKQEDFFGYREKQKEALHANLVKYTFKDKKEKIIRDDLSYGVEIYNTFGRIYFTYEKWNGKYWDSFDSYIEINNL